MRDRVVAGVVALACAGAYAGEAEELTYQPAEALAGADAAAELRAWSAPAWTVRIEPLVWAAGVRADLRLPGGGGVVETEDLDIDEPEATPGGRFTLRSERFTAFFSGFGYSGDATTTLDRAIEIGDLSFGDGERVRSELDYTSVDLWFGWRVWEKLFEGDALSDPGVYVRVDLTVGARLYDIGLEVGAAGGGESTRADETWVEPTVGVALSLDILDHFAIGVTGNIGGAPFGDKTSMSANIEVTGEWRIADNVGVELGYRFLYADLESDDGDDALGLEGSVAGLFGAVVVRF